MRLEAKQITYRYPGSRQNILESVDFAVESAECVGIIAPSGYGKTTFGQILAGYRKPVAGEVLLDGQPLPQSGYCPVQMIWQHPEQAVNPRMKLRQVLAEGDRIAPHIVHALGIEEDWCERYPSELSGGELQRFCIARALGEGTRFLIADEISTMLDVITQSQLWGFLQSEAAKRKIGLIVISHDRALLKRVCTREVELVP